MVVRGQAVFACKRHVCAHAILPELSFMLNCLCLQSELCPCLVYELKLCSCPSAVCLPRTLVMWEAAIVASHKFARAIAF